MFLFVCIFNLYCIYLQLLHFWKLKKCKPELYVLTVGGHEETSVDLFGVTEVWLDLVAAHIELPLVDAAGFDVEHIKTVLLTIGGGQSLCVCVFNIWFQFDLPFDFCHRWLRVLKHLPAFLLAERPHHCVKEIQKKKRHGDCRNVCKRLKFSLYKK